METDFVVSIIHPHESHWVRVMGYFCFFWAGLGVGLGPRDGQGWAGRDRQGWTELNG